MALFLAQEKPSVWSPGSGGFLCSEGLGLMRIKRSPRWLPKWLWVWKKEEKSDHWGFLCFCFFFCFVFFAVQGEASLLSFGQNSAVWPHSRARGAGKDSLVISSRGTFLPQAGVSVPIL